MENNERNLTELLTNGLDNARSMYSDDVAGGANDDDDGFGDKPGLGLASETLDLYWCFAEQAD